MNTPTDRRPIAWSKAPAMVLLRSPEPRVTVIRYADCEGTLLAYLHESAVDAVLTAETDEAERRCEALGIEVIPPDDAWADSYIVESGTPEWKRMSAEAHGGDSSPETGTEADGADLGEQAFDLFVRTPGGVWAKVGNDLRGIEPTDALADLVAVLGPYRVRLDQAEGDVISSRPPRPD